MPVAPRRLSPAQLLALSFALLISVGALLLSLPWSSTRAPLGIADAIFTAASAACVTGLIVVDTPNDLTVFGQLVVLFLIQAGGLGYMVISSVLVAALGRQLTVHDRLTLQEALNVQTMEDLIRFALTVLKLTLAFELAGAAILAVWWAGDFGWARAAYLGVFHAVSAFNNAGFALFSDNLMRFRTDPVVNLVIAGLVIAGGLGFLVLTELGRWRTQRLSLHSRLVLVATAILLAAGTVAILGIERWNPRTLGPLGPGEAVMAAFFQAVVPRTAGFNTVDVAALAPATLFVIMILMFIGAGPGSTAGGIKVTTLSIAVAALWATVRGIAEPTLLRRRLGAALVQRAFFISLIAFLALNSVTMVLLVTEGRDLLPTLFEATSAFGTVGLSMSEGGAPVSLSAGFTAFGKLLIAAMMFMGRVGPLTLAVALARRRSQPRIRYPEGKILIG